MHLYSNSLYMYDVKYVANLALHWEKLKGKSLMLSGAEGLIGGFLMDVIMEKNVTHELS